MMTTNRHSLTPNAPAGRLKYIVKTYGEKQPWVVLDTLSVIFNTIGIDRPEPELEETLDGQGSPVWGDALFRMKSRLRSMFSHNGQLHPGIIRHSEDTLSKVPYRKQLDFWWFGDADVGKTVPVHLRPASTLNEKLALILELTEAETFASGAMREQNEADSIFPWVARELSKLSKHTIAKLDSIREPGTTRDTAEEGLVMSWSDNDAVDYETDVALHTDEERSRRDLRFPVYNDYSRALDSLRKSGNAIAQWATAKRIDIMKLSLAEVLEAIKTYRPKSVVKPGQRGEVVYRFKKTDWVVEDLKKKRQLDCEADFLSHCVYTYEDAIERGKSVIYSLRDPDGVPYVTMEWQPEHKNALGHASPRFTQVFGKTNSKIGDEVFNEYVFEAGQSNEPPLRREEVPEVVEFIRAMVVEFIDKAKGGDVSGLVLAGASLRGRNLSHMTLQAPLHDRDLTDANLSGANLRHMDLTGAILTNADLTNADLTEAEMPDTILIGANLTNADLTGAFMTEANLSGANLSGANLSGANLRAADLTNANATGAKYDSGTRWPKGRPPWDTVSAFDPVAAGAVNVST